MFGDVFSLWESFHIKMWLNVAFPSVLTGINIPSRKVSWIPGWDSACIHCPQSLLNVSLSWFSSQRLPVLVLEREYLCKWRMELTIARQCSGPVEKQILGTLLNCWYATLGSSPGIPANLNIWLSTNETSLNNSIPLFTKAQIASVIYSKAFLKIVWGNTKSAELWMKVCRGLFIWWKQYN